MSIKIVGLEVYPASGGKSNLPVRRNEMKVEGAMKQIKDRFMALK